MEFADWGFVVSYAFLVFVGVLLFCTVLKVDSQTGCFLIWRLHDFFDWRR